MQSLQSDRAANILPRQLIARRFLPLRYRSVCFRAEAIVFALLFTCVIVICPQRSPAARSEFAETESARQPTGATAIYSAPDEVSLQIGTLAPGETAAPIAETQGAGGARWFLIKSTTGVTGWIKQAENEQAKKIDSFFKSRPVETATVPAAIPDLSSTAAPGGTILVPVLIAGRSTIVAVTLNQTVTGNLMLDTGATHTVISQRLAGALSLRPAGRSAVQTVGGVVTVTMSRLRSLKVGQAEVSDLPIIVHDFSRDPRIDGLLGMDFLGRYRFGLDAQRQILVLSPR